MLQLMRDKSFNNHTFKFIVFGRPSDDLGSIKGLVTRGIVRPAKLK